MPRLKHIGLIGLIGLFGLIGPIRAQQDSVQVKKNRFMLDVDVLAQGEIREGGISPQAQTTAEETGVPPKDRAMFVLGRTRLIVGYEREWFSTRVNVQHTGIWGQENRGTFNLYEGWAKLQSKQGLFLQVGRQVFSYDDERIIGPNDWAMDGFSHDALRFGYEGYGHKVHGIACYNQNADNPDKGITFFQNGSVPYKTMQTLWYHYDAPFPLSASLLFMNVGMQAGEPGNNEHVAWQQLIGTYIKYKPGFWTIEGSFYKQMGHEENDMPLDAYMFSIKSSCDPAPFISAYAGYEYLSGDPYFNIPPHGGVGLIRHEVCRGFNPVYGSHHKFYGAMDFFYVSTFVNGFTPGLQNAYTGVVGHPVQGLDISLAYHYMAMAAHLEGIKPTLGHEVDFEASYQIIKEVSVSLGFSYMGGTETMTILKRASDEGRLYWGWLSIRATPRCLDLKF